MTQQQPMSREQEQRLRQQFDVQSIIASAGQPMQRPRLNIVDEIPTSESEAEEQLNRKHTCFHCKKVTKERDAKASNQGLCCPACLVPFPQEAAWSKLVRPGMTVGEIKELIRQHGSAEEVAALNRASKGPEPGL